MYTSCYSCGETFLLDSINPHKCAGFTLEEIPDETEIRHESDFNPRPWLDKAPHYEHNGMDVRDVIETFELNFNEGSIIKYILRRKPGNPRLMDLKKARVCIEREIAVLERMMNDV